jgi:hypothetical protein
MRVEIGPSAIIPLIARRTMIVDRYEYVTMHYLDRVDLIKVTPLPADFEESL